MSDILRELLCVAEKAANIARACRQQEALFQLLIEEKKEGEKNKKFTVDFKTLADVLVQEVIKQNMENKFPGLKDKISGEESNEFTNDLGEKITMRLCSTEAETVELLSKVLNGNQQASEALASVVHQDVSFTDPALDSVDISIPQDTLGIWVDPIDSTYQYIKGSGDIKPDHGIFPSGLQCVTILIGVYDRQTGIPLMGVINQPFVSQDPDTLRWKGQCYWGISYLGTNAYSLQYLIPKSENRETPSQLTENTSTEAKSQGFSAVISTSEKETIKAALLRVCGERIFRAAGAGYKSLCVVQGLVDIYIFSEDTTFKWDSCAAHAILRSMGGGMVDLKACLEREPEKEVDLPQLVYHVANTGASGVDRWANKGGLIAYRSKKRLDAFLSLLFQYLVPADTSLDPGVPRDRRGGREAGRRQPPPPPQEAERCTWRLGPPALNPETGPAGSARGEAEPGGRGEKVAPPGAPTPTAASPAAPRSPHPPGATERRRQQQVSGGLARRRGRVGAAGELHPGRRGSRRSQRGRGAHLLRAHLLSGEGAPERGPARAAGGGPAPRPPRPPPSFYAACHLGGVLGRLSPAHPGRQHFRKRNWSRENKGAGRGALAARPQLPRVWGVGPVPRPCPAQPGPAPPAPLG
ncbi:PREDICTED: inositol polyphosphate 1-phosphatase [Elephantulus edwardii]|uniref:inositol polyphosphate 1-phosphatase n=1 Tax=Elephantulus edwardii TaxID=28737 RepID=UPI0003F08297|nr:PREDICTED: inositol polyphosphate 1-phosphatase [Elephantulus edwardii]